MTTTTLTKAHIQTFEGNLRHLAQQSDTYLRRWVQEKSGSATSRHTFPRMAKMSLASKGSRDSTSLISYTGGRLIATPYEDPTISNRVALATKYDGGSAIEKEDPVQMAIDPGSAITKALGAACKRKIDEIIIDAATAAALDEAGATPGFPAGQKIGDGSKEFGFAMVTEVNEKFLSNDIDPAEPKVFVIGPKQARLLLHEAEATSSDYANSKALVAGGFIRNWMGFDWIVSNQLNSGDTGHLSCLAFTRQALGLLVIEDIYAKVAEDPSASFATRFYAALNMGAVRVEDEHIVHVEVLDTASV